jgi:hypothetical protein
MILCKPNYYTVEGEQYSDFALGFGLGSKWIQKRICF